MSIERCCLLLLLLLLSPITVIQASGDSVSSTSSTTPNPSIDNSGCPVTVAELIERLGYRQQFAHGIARFNTYAVERKIEALKDRRERQQRRERLHAVAERIEDALSWPRLAPLIEAAWCEHIDAEQLATLSALLDTPAGHLYADKGMNALSEAGIDQAIHLDSTIDEVFDRPANVRPPRLRAVREPTASSHAGLALRWLRLHEPELGQVFAQRQSKALADARLVFQGGDENGSIDPEHQVILDAFAREIRLADLEQIAVQRLTRDLSRAELTDLVAAFETPGVQGAMAARGRADRAVGEKATELVQSELQPGLLIELMRILMD